MEERVLIEGVANEVKGFFVENGHGLLTNRRFIYSKHNVAKTLMIGALVNLTMGSFKYEIPLSDISSISVGSFRLGSALTIMTHSGGTYKFGVLKPTEWDIAIQNAMRQPPEKAAEPGAHDILSQIEKLAAMKEKNILAEAEYEAKKAELLARL